MAARKSSEFLKECISDAVLALVRTKPIEKITVDEIVREAGVGRATYFRMYKSKYEAVTFKLVKLWERYAEANSLSVRNRFDLSNARVFFEYNYSIRDTLDTIYDAGLQECLHDSFTQIMLPVDDADDWRRTYREEFYAQGLYGLLDAWIRRSYRETPEEMARILIVIIRQPGVPQPAGDADRHHRTNSKPPHSAAPTA